MYVRRTSSGGQTASFDPDRRGIAVNQIPASAAVVGWDLSELDQEIKAEER